MSGSQAQIVGPSSTITGGPSDPTNATAAAFAFSSDDPSASFECALDAAPFAPCASPASYGGLAAGVHTFQVRAIDVLADVGSPVASSWTVDTTAPNESAIGVGGVSENAATVNWSTDEAADGQVEYGTSTAYGQITAVDPSLAAAHALPLAGLAPGTLYNYRVLSRDTAGNLAVSGNYTFSTPDAPPTVVASVPSGGVKPWDTGVDTVLNRIYVSNETSGTLSVIDGTTNLVIGAVPVGAAPRGVAVNTSSHRVYVANYNSKTVSVVDGLTNLVVANVLVGSGPIGVAVNESTNKVYAVNMLSRTMSVIDGNTNLVVGTVTGLGFGPWGVAVNPGLHRAYVTNYNQNSVSVVSTDTNTVIQNVVVGAGPRGVAVNPSTNRVYVANGLGNSVTVLNGTSTSTSTVATIPLGLGASPYDVTLNPSTKRVYVTNSGPNTVSVIDGNSNAVIATVAVGADPFGIAFNTSTTRAYTANSLGNSVSVLQD